MLSHLLCLPILLTLFLPLITPSTASTLPLDRRRQHVCFNDGKTKARDLLLARSLPSGSDTSPLTLRADPPFEIPIPCTWGAPGTHVFLQINSLVPNANLQASQTSLLTEALNLITKAITQHGDGLVPAGVFDLTGFGFHWHSTNTNNHQQTWGTLKSAVAALLSFYIRNEVWGPVTFWVYDGLHAVADGAFQPV